MTQTPPYQVTDPATGEVTETFPFATDAEVAEALAAATEAFAVWRLRPVAERAAVVKRIAELFTERAADLVAQIMKDAGVPDGAYVNLFATHEQVAAMIADPRLRGVSLTGSERAGTVVAETAGRNLKKVVLELGGSDPYIILDTPDVEAAAETAWTTRMENVGQVCNSNKRMIVMDDVYDDFVAALVKRAAA